MSRRLPRLPRLLIAVILAVWALVALYLAWLVWLNALTVPPATSYDAGRATLEDADLYQLFKAAQSDCPADQPLLVLSEDVRADQQGNYILYPRRVDVMRNADPFGAPDLDAHRGGCLLFYDADKWRLTAFAGRLSELACVGENCLYRIG